ncbi:conserved hypothetical protein [Neospora caninum Liverpool]|uniref:Uncharacterized protein n=1 Tax=Neospora caninum (strain Liverpool) TaxID=572307 RepID=F0VDD4_NEOCL|nr:conserved hypothetical protein [Neospora caninum Liverpool]CBZ51649.1 conserved hypothetical protein [Neospora caninum Liverpool]CEL65603.1 TPA: hypothetical protein BN1204_014430 [Neospora caninum Liverpool]|eukprot:XP_003881682.1 conserved hypothetical protein [Neospora caninum Liverpool]
MAPAGFQSGRSQQSRLANRGGAPKAHKRLHLTPLHLLAFSFAAGLSLLHSPASPRWALLAPLPAIVSTEAVVADVVRRAKDAVGHGWRNGSRQIAEQFGVSHAYMKTVLPRSDPLGFEKYKLLASRYAELTQEIRDAAGTKDFEAIVKRSGREQEALLEEVDRVLEQALDPSLRPQLSGTRHARRGANAAHRESTGSASSSRTSSGRERSEHSRWGLPPEKRVQSVRSARPEGSQVRHGDSPGVDGGDAYGIELTPEQRLERGSLLQRLVLVSYRQRQAASEEEATRLEETKQRLLHQLMEFDARVQRQRYEGPSSFFNREDAMNQVMEERLRREQHVAARMVEAEMVLEETVRSLGDARAVLTELEAVPGHAAQIRERISTKLDELREATAAREGCVLDAFILSGGLENETQNLVASARARGGESLGRVRTALSRCAAGVNSLDALIREVGGIEDPGLQSRAHTYSERRHVMQFETAQIQAAAERIVTDMEVKQLQLETEAGKLQEVVGAISEACLAFFKKEEERLQAVSSKVAERVTPLLAALQRIFETAAALGQKQDLEAAQAAQQHLGRASAGVDRLPSTALPPAESVPESQEDTVEFKALKLQKELEPIVSEVSGVSTDARTAERQIMALMAAVATLPADAGTALATNIARVHDAITRAEQGVVAALSQAQAQVSVVVSKARRSRQAAASFGAFRLMHPTSWPSPHLRNDGARLGQMNADARLRQASAWTGHN